MHDEREKGRKKFISDMSMKFTFIYARERELAN
jgi:hypothetical protein